MFDNACPGRFAVRIIHRRISLEIRHIQHLRLKANRPVLQRPQAVSEISVDRTGVDHLIRQRIQCLLLFQIIHAEAHLRALQHICDHLRVTAHRNSLIACVKIIVIKRQPHRKTLNDKRRELIARSAPLLFRIAFDQLFIDICADQTDRLLLQILWLCDPGRFSLLLYLLRRLLWRHHTPHLVEGIHIKRK